MQHRFIAFIICFFCLAANAQRPEISYDIDGTYNDETHILEGASTIHYVNNSDKTLDRLYFHLWANAYNDKNSEYTKQSVRTGNIDFVYGDEEQLGGYQEIKVTIDGNEVPLEYQTPEITYILLPQPFLPGEEISISFDYDLKMPPKHDRFGHDGDDVFFSHFYPKVVVFEKGKWHKMPYLLYGEGYSEFADFKVNIAFDDYESIGSGRIHNKSRNNIEFSSTEVVDIALAISKTKKIQSFEVAEDTKVSVLTDKDINQDHVFRAVNFLEERVGAFPYKDLGVYVDGKSGGMEYPGLITIPEGTPEMQDHYIIHELAHEYFYATLANNQRKEGWIDEGFATFYEKAYSEKFYNEDYFTSQLPKRIKTERNILHAMSEHQIARGFADKLNTKATNSSPANYMLNHYEVPATYIKQLEAYLGQDEFDSCVAKMYGEQKHSHVNAETIKAYFPKASWIVEAMKADPAGNDYAVKDIKNGVLTTINKGKNTFPYPIQISNGDDIRTIWIEGHEGEQQTEIGNYTEAAIDPELITIDKNRRNNYSKRGLSIGLPKLFSDPAKRSAYVLPHLGYNTSDELMLGLGFSNGFLPYNPTKVFVAPSYALGSKTVTGIVDIRQDLKLKNETFRKLQIGVSGKRFSIKDKPYNKVSPFVALHFNHGNASQSYSKLVFTSNHINYDYDFANMPDEYRTSDWSHIQNLRYSFYNFFVLYPSEINIDIEHQAYTRALTRTSERYIRLTGEWKQKFAYRKGKSIDFRLFAGMFLVNTDRSSSNYNSPLFTRGSLSLWGDSSQDLQLNDYFFNRRNNYDGFLRRQVSDYNSGGFKNVFPQGYKIGVSNDYLATVGIKADLPIDLPMGLNIKAFFDYGIYNFKSTQESRFVQKGLYSGGLMVELAEGLLSFHLPLLNSSEINNIYKENRVTTFGKLTFKLDMKRFNLFDLSDDFNP